VEDVCEVGEEVVVVEVKPTIVGLVLGSGTAIAGGVELDEVVKGAIPASVLHVDD